MQRSTTPRRVQIGTAHSSSSTPASKRRSRTPKKRRDRRPPSTVRLQVESGGSTLQPSYRRAPSLVLAPGPSDRPTIQGAGRLDPYHRQLAIQFLTPVNTTQTVAVTPSSFPALVCARHFHKVFDVNSATFPNGFTAAMFPDLFNPGYISTSAAILVPPGGSGAIQLKGTFDMDTTGLICTRSVIQVDDSQDNSAVVALGPVADGVGLTYYAIPFTPEPAQAFVCDLMNVTNERTTGTIHLAYKIAGGNWTDIISFTMGQNATIGEGLTLPANATHLALYITNNSGKITKWKMNFGFTNQQVQCAAATSLGPGFASFIVDSNIQYGRVVSMSMLVTNTSAELYKGGSINAARVPNTFNPFASIPSQIADLPKNRIYQGDAATGAYVNWMPLQFDEFEIDNVNSKRAALNDAEYILCQIDAWALGASVKIQCDWIVEFNTPNQVYEKVMTPPLTDEFRQLYYHLLCMPAAMCNPSHDNLLKQLIQGGVKAYREGSAFYDKHRHTIDALAGILSNFAV